MGRMLTLLKKDYIHILFAPIITILIPVILLLIFNYTASSEILVGYSNDFNSDIGNEYKLVQFESVEEGISQLEEKKIMVFYDSTDNLIYTLDEYAQSASDIYNRINKIDRPSSEVNHNNLIILFISIIIVIGSLTSSTIIGVASNMERIKSFMLTPLSYTEFIFAKLIAVILSFWGTMLLAQLLMFLLGFTIDYNLGALVVFTSSGIFLLTMMSMLITLLIKNLEFSEMMNSLFIYGCLLISIYTYQSDYHFDMPIISGMKNIVNNNHFPILQFSLLLLLGGILLTLNVNLFRKKVRMD